MKRSIYVVDDQAPVLETTVLVLRSLGRDHVTLERVAHLRDALKPKDRKRLLKDLPFAPAWMHPFLRHIAGGEA